MLKIKIIIFLYLIKEYNTFNVVTLEDLTNQNVYYLFQYAAKYQFGYQVRDPKHGTFFGHAEARDGHHTKGHYHVLLPDGRLQNVQYWADLSGYHAQVSYNTVAKHAAVQYH